MKLNMMNMMNRQSIDWETVEAKNDRYNCEEAIEDAKLGQMWTHHWQPRQWPLVSECRIIFLSMTVFVAWCLWHVDGVSNNVSSVCHSRGEKILWKNIPIYWPWPKAEDQMIIHHMDMLLGSAVGDGNVSLSQKVIWCWQTNGFILNAGCLSK